MLDRGEPMSTTPVTITMVFQPEALEDCREDLLPLLEAHWREVAHFPDIPLDVDWEAYARAERAGALRIYTLRDFGALRGYAVYFVNNSMHYRGSFQAVQDVIYLVPELRGQIIGARFLQWCDERLAAIGVQCVYHHVKLAHDFGGTLKRLGYEQIESVWARRLDRP